MHKFTIRNNIMLNYYFYAYMYLHVLHVHLCVAVAGIDISGQEHYSIFWNYLRVCVSVTRLARGSWTRSRAHKNWACCPIWNIIQNLTHDLRPCSFWWGSMLKSTRKEHPAPCPGRLPLQLLINQENSVLHETTLQTVSFECDRFLSLS